MKKYTAQFWQEWNRWWLRPCPPHTMALVRVVLGLYLFFYIGRYAPHVIQLFSDTGTALPLFYQAHTPTITITLFTLLLIACITMAVGIRTRLSTAIVILLSLHFWQLGGHLFVATIQRILLLLLFAVFISGIDRSTKQTSILAQRLIAVTITAVYLGAGWQKFVLPAWEGGELLAYSLISSWATPLGFWIAQWNLSIEFYDATVWCVKFLFFVLPIGLWIPRLRIYAFALGALFHVLVALTLSIWSFLVLIPLYIVFMPPERVQQFLKHSRLSL